MYIARRRRRTVRRGGPPRDCPTPGGAVVPGAFAVDFSGMSNRFQAPKGTRDFFPDAMAVRRFIEDTWRRVSIRFGFLEVDGPTFESLDLYKVKSGEEIVSQLFHFQDRGDRSLALRPEFTPTVARMVAEKAGTLPRPIKWFGIPRCYRAEQPQKGRLREFIQWNADVIGDATGQADTLCMALCVAGLQEFGFTPADVRIGWNDRALMTEALSARAFSPARMPMVYELLDKMHKLDANERHGLYEARACSTEEVRELEALAAAASGPGSEAALEQLMDSWPDTVRSAIRQRQQEMDAAGIGEFCRFDVSVVRGLAYYTGLVFEAFDATGTNRAVAGGGRYDQLIGMFGGPDLPAAGFGMGDAVLEILLREKNRLPARLMPTPDVFVISVLEDASVPARLLMRLRGSVWDESHGNIVLPGLIALSSGKATKNLGKLLQEAVSSGARHALLLLPEEHARGAVRLRDLAQRTEQELPLEEAIAKLRSGK